MTLRDALAAVLRDTGPDSPYLDGGEHDRQWADAILSDPAFRDALVEAVGTAVRAEWPSHREGSSTYNNGVAYTTGPEWTVLDPALPSSLDYAAIVARMLGDDVTLDLDAIRARDAGLVIERHPNATVAHISVHDGDCLQSALDRRALLAEVDRLRALPPLAPDYEQGRSDGAAEERARALPVIEAARALLRRSGSVLMTDAEQEDWAALRAALAEYDR